MNIWASFYQQNEKTTGCWLCREERGQRLYSDLRPWPELGQPSLSDLIQEMSSQEGLPPLVKRAFETADVDPSLEIQNFKEWVESQSPHHLVRDVAHIPQHQGRALKIKMGQNLEQETKVLETLADKGQTRLRLDFNEKLNSDQFIHWWSQLPITVQKSIEWVEDPCIYDRQLWPQWQSQGIPLAMDWTGDPLKDHDGYQFLVVKPQSQDWQTFLELPELREKVWVVTHVMDSALGRLHCLFESYKIWSAGVKNLEFGWRLDGLSTEPHLQDPVVEWDQGLKLDTMKPLEALHHQLERLKWQPIS